MISKTQIQALKQADLSALYHAITHAESGTELTYILENLGRLPSDFDGDILSPYLMHKSANIRYWAVKNMGKLGQVAYLDALYHIAQTDEDSLVRREAVSAIGRMRQLEIIPPLLKLLDDTDPKVTLQAIRGLLTFRNDAQVKACLSALQHHPNEQIQLILQKEFQPSQASQDYGAHTQSPDYMKNTAVLGDVRDTLRLIPDGAMHLTFTSPPYYNARDYSIYNSYEGYLDFLTDVFAEVHRTTKEGRFLVVNTSPIIIPRISRKYASKRYAIPFDLHARLAKIGWEFIDDIVWAKPEASVKNRNGGFLQHRKPLAYKPNAVTEYVMVYRKESNRLIDWNMKQYDTQTIADSLVDSPYETSNLWQIDPRSDKVHTAIFPDKLCEAVVRYYSYVGDLVFDPFGGSGTLGRVALRLNRHFFLTEIMEEYFERMQENIGQDLFQTYPTHFLTLQSFINRKEQAE